MALSVDISDVDLNSLCSTFLHFTLIFNILFLSSTFFICLTCTNSFQSPEDRLRDFNLNKTTLS